MARARKLALLAAASFLLSSAGCGGGSGTSSTGGGGGSSAAGAPATVAVTISDFTYRPPTITVARGGKVTWRNLDATPHTATVGGPHAFDTGSLKRGASRTIALSTPGTYHYTCSFHPFMHGTVRVIG
jgi:plastocyanin